MLCRGITCHDMISHDMLSHACYVMTCYVMTCSVMTCYVMTSHVMTCYVMTCYVMTCYAMTCYVMTYYVMTCYVPHFRPFVNVVWTLSERCLARCLRIPLRINVWLQLPPLPLSLSPLVEPGVQPASGRIAWFFTHFNPSDHETVDETEIPSLSQACP